MKCPQCKLVEMLVEKVRENVIVYVCKKCGNTEEVENKVNKETE